MDQILNNNLSLRLRLLNGLNLKECMCQGGRNIVLLVYKPCH